jgi:phage shock protein PspC (stress-responsive transcriptional regulator)
MNATAETPTPSITDNTLGGARAWFAERGLSRTREHRVIAGVSGAFARRYDVNPFVARFVTIALAIGFTPLAYVAMWVLMPSEG